MAHINMNTVVLTIQTEYCMLNTEHCTPHTVLECDILQVLKIESVTNWTIPVQIEDRAVQHSVGHRLIECWNNWESKQVLLYKY